MTSSIPSDLVPREARDEVQPRVDPIGPRGAIVAPSPIVAHRRTDPHKTTGPHGQTGPGSLVAPQGEDPARTAEGDTPPAARGPTTRRSASADSGVSLGPLGWLAVLLVAVLLAVLAHAANVRSGEGEHRESSLLTDPAYVLAQ